MLDYGIGIWNISSAEKFEKLDQIQQRAVRYFCGVPRASPILGLEGEMGWVPGVVRRDLECLQLHNQILKMPPDSDTRLVHERDRKLKAHHSWSSNVMEICRAAKQMENYNSGSVVNLKDAKNSLMGDYAKNWRNCVLTKPKLANYAQVKSEWGAEKFMYGNVSKERRSLMCQLRLGVLPLEVEVGRFT